MTPTTDRRPTLLPPRMGAILAIVMLGPATLVRAQATVAFSIVPDGDPPAVDAHLVPLLPEAVFPELLADGGKASANSGWKAHGDEIDGGLEWSSVGGGHRMRVSRVKRAGTAFLARTIKLEGTAWQGRALDFRVRARDESGVGAYAFLLREVGWDGEFRDTEIEGGPTRGTWKEFAARWTPRTGRPRALIVHLRCAVLAGATLAVAFDSPSLRPAATYRWTDHGRPAGAGLSLVLSDLPGPSHVIRLEAVEELTGVTAHGERRLTFSPPKFRAEIDAPSLVLSESPFMVSAAGTRSPQARDALPGWASSERGGWRLEAGEIGSRATVAFEKDENDATDAVIRVTEARSRGSVFLVQDVPLPGDAHPLDLVVRHRDDGHILHYAFLLRQFVPGGGPPAYVDTVVEAEPVASWAWTHLRWTPRPGARHGQVMLRFMVEAGSSAEVRFRAAHLTPALRFRWELPGGVHEGGYTAVVGRLSPGAHTVSLTAAQESGPEGPTATAVVLAAREAPVACRVGEGARLLWNPGTDLSGHSFELRMPGSRRVAGPLPGPKDSWVLDLPGGTDPSDTTLVLAEGPARKGLEVVEAAPIGGTPALATSVDAGVVAPGGTVAYRVRTCGEPLETIPLVAGSRRIDLPARALGGGMYEASFHPRPADFFRTYRAWGVGEPVSVTVTLEFVFLLGVGLAATTLAWARRRPALSSVSRWLFGESLHPNGRGDRELPIPPHFEARRAGELWLVPHAAREREARSWAAEHAIPPAAADHSRIRLVLVDVSNRLCMTGAGESLSEDGRLPAAGDTARLCAFIYRNLSRITSITVSLADQPDGRFAGVADALVPAVEEAVMFHAAARQTVPGVAEPGGAATMIEGDVLLVAGQPLDGGVAAFLAALAAARAAAGRTAPRIVLLEDCTSPRGDAGKVDVDAIFARLHDVGVERMRSTEIL